MYNGNRITAVVAAAGKGTRMNSPINKQYLMIRNRPVLAQTLNVFQKCEWIDTVVVVVAREDMEYCVREVVVKYGMTKVEKVLPGGDTRQRSVATGLEMVEGGIVVVHDGARPFFDCHQVENGIKRLLEGRLDGAACAVPVKDTIKLIDENEAVKGTLDRQTLRAVQTPQCFWVDKIKEAHQRADREGLEVTDDLSLLEHYGYNVGLYRGSYNNIKITTQEDLLFARALIEGRSRT